MAHTESGKKGCSEVARLAAAARGGITQPIKHYFCDALYAFTLAGHVHDKLQVGEFCSNVSSQRFLPADQNSLFRDSPQWGPTKMQKWGLTKMQKLAN